MGRPATRRERGGRRPWWRRPGRAIREERSRLIVVNGELRNLYARNDIRPAYRMHMRVDVVAFTAMVSPKLDNVLGEVLCAEDNFTIAPTKISTMKAPPNPPLPLRCSSLTAATDCVVRFRLHRTVFT